ncbi:hypothetical protein BXZ70DRAFT_951091 [Cristinia sonorae]|uniref:Uncharacterized protein n=1 Tax=Cristinia sonorae TaxID=1940300 RepID=A0A8K0XMJ3_9AGAR|nr:hypothetical protein BXZ70DRAFT_951091 [Cristinia sonorae]
MLAQRAIRLSSGRLLRISSALQAGSTRGYAETGGDNNKSRDPLHQGYEQGKKTHKNPQDTSSSDSAASHAASQTKAPQNNLSGNPEGVGFVEQVGSHSSSAKKDASAASSEGFSGKENITPPSFVDAVKNKLGMKTSAGQDKQNRGGGVGVTGTGKSAFSTSAWAGKDATTTGQAPEASRQPKERTNADQNAHLKHRASASQDGKQGKGNAAENPTLPSHQFNDKKPKSAGAGTRGFSTSVSVLDKSSGHTAESYFKDVDSVPPNSSKTHQVDSSSAGAQVQRANEPQTGQFSESGPGDKEYQTMSKQGQPYDTPPSSGSEKEQKLRYGGEPQSPQRPDGSDQGPQGASKGGRKPEGRS